MERLFIPILLGALSSLRPGSFEIPKAFVFVPELPRTEKGAIDRRKLAEQCG